MIFARQKATYLVLGLLGKMLCAAVDPGPSEYSYPDIDRSLVKVCSRYSAQESVCGVGSYLSKDDRFFVLTAAHVSQGSLGTELWSHTSPAFQLQVKARRVDNVADLEVLEVQPDARLLPLATWDPGEEAFLVAHESFFIWNILIGRSKLEHLPSPHWMHHLGDHSALLLPTSFVATAPTKGRAFEEEYDFSSERGAENRRLRMPVFDPFERVLKFKIKAGMSGAPSMGTYNASYHPAVKLNGLVTRKHRYAPLSYFAAEARLQKIFAWHFRSTKNIQWKLEGGILYREMADGTREWAQFMPPGGGGASSDGGGGASTDGTRGLNERQANALALRHPRMTLRGRELLGWETQSSSGRPLYFLGSYSNLRTLNERNVRAKELPLDTPVSLLLARAAYQKDSAHFSLRNAQGDVLEFNQGPITIWLAREKLSLRLDQWASLGQKKFYPIIKVGARTVDLSEVFFIESSYRRIYGPRLEKASTRELLEIFGQEKRLWVDDRLVIWNLNSLRDSSPTRKF